MFHCGFFFKSSKKFPISYILIANNILTFWEIRSSFGVHFIRNRYFPGTNLVTKAYLSKKMNLRKIFNKNKEKVMLLSHCAMCVAIANVRTSSYKTSTQMGSYSFTHCWTGLVHGLDTPFRSPLIYCNTEMIIFRFFIFAVVQFNSAPFWIGCGGLVVWTMTPPTVCSWICTYTTVAFVVKSVGSR